MCCFETKMCVDYRALNKLIVRDSYPLQLIGDSLEHLEGNGFFDVRNLKS